MELPPQLIALCGGSSIMFYNEISCLTQTINLWNIMELPPQLIALCGGSSIMLHNEINCLTQKINSLWNIMELPPHNAINCLNEGSVQCSRIMPG